MMAFFYSFLFSFTFYIYFIPFSAIIQFKMEKGLFCVIFVMECPHLLVFKFPSSTRLARRNGFPKNADYIQGRSPFLDALPFHTTL